MQRCNPTSRQRGFALVFVILLSAAIVWAAATVALVAQVESRSSTRSVKGVNAFAIAYAGLQRGLEAAEVGGSLTIDALNNLLDGTSTSETVGGVTFYKFDDSFTDHRHAANRTVFGDGFYRLFLLDDKQENDNNLTTDSNGTVLVRSYGWIGEDAEAMVEGTFRLPLLYLLPGAVTACLANSDEIEVEMKGEFGPGWPYFNWRLDGGSKPPLTLSDAAFRVDGFARDFGTPPASPVTYDNWFLFDQAEGSLTTSHTVGPYRLIDGVASPTVTGSLLGPTRVVDEGIINNTAGAKTGLPAIGWGNRPFGLQAWPADINATSLPSATGLTQYRIPTIGFKNTPAPREASEQYFENVTGSYAGQHEDTAERGFYGCNRDSSADGDDYKSVGVCSSGVAVNSSGQHYGWKFDDSTHGEAAGRKSGMVWNVIQTVLRKCQGSGDSATCCNDGSAPCAGDYSFLNNIAKCLILPNNSLRESTCSSGDRRDTGGTDADYQDGAADPYDAVAPDVGNKVWFPGGYPKFSLKSTDAAYTGIGASLPCDHSTASECDYQWSAAKILSLAGLCTDSYGYIHVKYCDENEEDLNGLDCRTNPNAWSPNYCGRNSCDPAGVCPTGANWSSGASATPDGSLHVSDYYSSPGPDATWGQYCDPGDYPCDSSDGVDSMSEANAVVSAVADNDWGDFTKASDDCVFEFDETQAIGAERTGAVGSGKWRSVAINLDPYHVHHYGPVDSPTRMNGERGSIHFIARLDATDAGPLGACGANIDMTGDSDFDDAEDIVDLGTCLSGGTSNLSTAVSSNMPHFNATAADPVPMHPRTYWPSLFSRPLPGHDPWLPAAPPEDSFCDSSSVARELFDALRSVAANPDSVIANDASDLPSYPSSCTSNVSTASATYCSYADGVASAGTFGGAVCKYDSQKTNDSYGGWYVSECGDYEVVRVDDTELDLDNRMVCGCGVLIIQATDADNDGEAEASLEFDSGSSAIVWRGLVVLMTSSDLADESQIEFEIDVGGGNNQYFYVDGGVLAAQTGSSTESEFDMEWELMDNVDNNETDEANINVYVRLNPTAINEALSRLNVPNRSFRQVF